MTTTNTTQPLTTGAFQKAVCGLYDQINNPRVKRGDGTVVIKESYFYTFGKTAQDWADKVKANCEANGLKVEVTAENHHADWPKSSYWFAIVKQVTE